MSTDIGLVNNTYIVCMNEIKLNLMSSSFFCKGLSTMLCNLFVSSEEADSQGRPWEQVGTSNVCLPHYYNRGVACWFCIS
jgi:hypothetical protein